MGAPEALKKMSSKLAGSGPAFGRTQHNHWPPRPAGYALLTRRLLILTNLADTMLSSGRHCLMHAVDVGAFHKIGSPAVAAKQVFEFLARNARRQRRVVDLVAVQVKDGKN